MLAVVAYLIGNEVVCESCLKDSDEPTGFIEEETRDKIPPPIICKRCGTEC